MYYSLRKAKRHPGDKESLKSIFLRFSTLKQRAVKNLRFLQPMFEGIGKKDAERTNRAKTSL